MIEEFEVEDNLEVESNEWEGVPFDDSGVVIDEKEEGLRREFEEQKRLEEATRWARIEEKIQNGIEVDKYIDTLDEWQGNCVICKAKGTQGDIGHDWRECSYERSEIGKMERVLGTIEQIPFERYSGCSFCRVPQKVCHLWEEDNVRGPIRFKRRKGGKCQYEGVLLPVAAAIQSFRWDDRMALWLEKEQESVGYEELYPELDTWEKQKRWFGRKVVWHGIEISELSRMVYIFS